MLTKQEAHESTLHQLGSADRNLLLNEHRAQTLSELAHFYFQLEPDKGQDGFAADFFRPMSADLSVNGERFRAEFVSIAESGQPVDLRFAAMTAVV